MGLTSGFFNAISGDRTYDALQMSRLFDGIISDGVFASIGSAFVVSPSSGMNISVGVGRAWFNHTWTYNDSIMVLPVIQSEVVLNRLDRVVLEIDTSDAVRANSIKVIKGTPATTPVLTPLINTSTLHQYPLATISVLAGVTSITPDKITNEVGTASCPFITGIIESIDVSTFFAQWNAQFDIWFATMQNQLSVDAAGSLQNQINEIKGVFTSTGTSTAYIITTPRNSPLTTWESFRVMFHTNAGAAPTLNRDSKGAKSLKYYDGSGQKQSCSSSQIKANVTLTILYDGVDYVLLGGSGASPKVLKLSNSSPIVLTANGTWTKPIGLSYIEVEVVGAGGAGAGAPVTGAGVYSCGGGGGGGGYSKKKILSAALGATEAVTVGAGGVSPSGASGGAGGTSSFGAHLSATGGAGGSVGSASATLAFITPGGGGVGANGNINAGGDPGGPGVRNSLPYGGNGGGSILGGGGAGQVTAGAFGGNPGLAYGGGGSGAANVASQSARSGGAGAPGVVIIWEYVEEDAS